MDSTIDDDAACATISNCSPDSTPNGACSKSVDSQTLDELTQACLVLRLGVTEVRNPQNIGPNISSRADVVQTGASASGSERSGSGASLQNDGNWELLRIACDAALAPAHTELTGTGTCQDGPSPYLHGLDIGCARWCSLIHDQVAQHTHDSNVGITE